MHWSMSDDDPVTHFPAQPTMSPPQSIKHSGICSAEITENNSEVIARTQTTNFATEFILSTLFSSVSRSSLRMCLFCVVLCWKLLLDLQVYILVLLHEYKSMLHMG